MIYSFGINTDLGIVPNLIPYPGNVWSKISEFEAADDFMEVKNNKVMYNKGHAQFKCWSGHIVHDCQIHHLITSLDCRSS